jgi:alkylation response protein AidB-like acyl-CoA dehydrogenase
MSTSVPEFRRTVVEFLGRALPGDWAGVGALAAQERREFLDRWRRTLAENGYLGCAWPTAYGGAGYDLVRQSVVQEEFARAGVPHLPWPTDGFSFNLIAPVLLHWGTEEQKRHYLPRMISGEHRWCQGYSEPDAGSDLFNLRTRATRDGDDWVLDGQKTWQTAGTEANWIFVLARTGTREERAKGLSLLLVPLDQVGVTVRPIRTMTGQAEFSEVFFDCARTRVADTVGPVGEGARVALTLLGFERGTASGALHVAHRLELERLVALARRRGRAGDPLVRQRLAWCYGRVEALGQLSRRILARAAGGGPPGPESSVLKLYVSEYHARLTELAVDILGMDAAVASGAPSVAQLGPDPLGSPNTALAWVQKFMIARAATIYGGSSQIQRSTIGERVLGLPREPRVTAPGRAS